MSLKGGNYLQPDKNQKFPVKFRIKIRIFSTTTSFWFFLISVDLSLNLTPNSRRRPTPALPIPSLQPRRNVETEKRLRALKTGSLKINGTSYDTNVNDLEYLSELGNGTSGHVVKMKHKPSGAIIAVKVRVSFLNKIRVLWLYYYFSK